MAQEIGTKGKRKTSGEAVGGSPSKNVVLNDDGDDDMGVVGEVDWYKL